MFSFQELSTDPYNIWACVIMLKHEDMAADEWHNNGPCIFMLKQEVMVVDEWHDNGSQDLITVSLCFQVAIDII